MVCNGDNCLKDWKNICPIFLYNIASRATQSNLVFVSVLKIPIVHADSVSKSIRRIFLRERQLLVRGITLYFATIIDTNRDYPPVPKRRQFCDLFSWARVFKWGRKTEKQRKGDSASVPSQFASLNNHFWYCCLFFASDLMHNSTSHVVKQLVHAFSCALSSYGALGKFGEQSRSFSCALQSNFPRAP